jgi:hypothetical protein
VGWLLFRRQRKKKKFVLATLEMDFTVAVYTKEGTNRFVKVRGRSLVPTWLLQPKYTEGTDMIGTLE